MARKPKAPKDMSTLLNSTTGTLAQIKAKTNSLNQLCNIVRQICPDLPEDALNIANFSENTLVIEVKSPVWGQRLQFERNNICHLLAEMTRGQYTQIEIKVNPFGHQQAAKKASFARNTKTMSAKNMSTKSAQHLLEVAEHAPPSLKAKLIKLAGVANKNKN
ncbi:MAG: DciA family protein [Litorilituus sp.]|jgi:hypothetical protein|nr:DciA family protein [Litorilituus sp.]